MTIRLPDNTYILDASQSADDEEDPLHYHWELISKPVEAPPVETSEKAILSLKNLQEGVYEFKLVVHVASLSAGLFYMLMCGD